MAIGDAAIGDVAIGDAAVGDAGTSGVAAVAGSSGAARSGRRSPAAAPPVAANRVAGSSMVATSPTPRGDETDTPMPCRAASRATTWKPSRCDTERSTSGGRISSAFVAANCGAGMPTPESSTVSSTPPSRIRSGRARSDTVLSGGENRTAFSTSSAIRWVRSVTTCPVTAGSTSTVNSTRSGFSVSTIAARSTSRIGTARLITRGGCWPASTSRLSALRRTRVARWSRANSSASVAGSRSACAS